MSYDLKAVAASTAAVAQHQCHRTEPPPGSFLWGREYPKEKLSLIVLSDYHIANHPANGMVTIQQHGYLHYQHDITATEHSWVEPTVFLTAYVRVQLRPIRLQFGTMPYYTVYLVDLLL